MEKKDHSIIAIGCVNLLATIYSLVNPTLAAKMPDIYLASIGGLWAKYQLEQSNEDKENK